MRLPWVHRQFLDQTTPAHYAALKAKRGIDTQTLKRHELAYDAEHDRWLIPFKNPEGNVVNIQLYHPNQGKPNKFNLPGLPTSLYGWDKLSGAGMDKPVVVCEGPFDAIALDYSLSAANRPKYVIVATPGSFKEEWAEHFRDRKVWAFYHNDKAGEGHGERVRKLLGESRGAAALNVLKWPAGYPDGCDLNDLIRRREFKGTGILGWLMERSRVMPAK